MNGWALPVVLGSSYAAWFLYSDKIRHLPPDALPAFPVWLFYAPVVRFLRLCGVHQEPLWEEPLDPKRRYLVVCHPHGEHDGRPPEVLPSPPPIGWSTGFMATPRTFGRRPIHEEAPALPRTRPQCCSFDSCPIVAMHLDSTWRISPLCNGK